MFFKKNIAKDNENKDSIQVLTEAAETIAACSREIKEGAETIALSCQIPGSKGEVYRDILIDKAKDLRRVSTLYDSASSRLITAVKKLEGGAPEAEVLSDVLIYNTFLNDQLKAEEKESTHILNILRKDHVDR